MRYLVMTMLAGAVCVATPPLTPEEKARNIESFEKVWKTVGEHHWDPKMGGLDWQKVHDEYRPEMDKAETTDAARAIMRKMLGRLGVSHYGILPADVYKDLHSESGKVSGDGTTGLSLDVIDEHGVVRLVDPGSPAEQAGVKTGWRVVAVNDEKLDPVIAKIHALKAPHLDLTMKGMLQYKLTRKPGDILKVEFLNEKDAPVTLNLTLAPPRGKTERFGFLPPFPVWFESRKLDNEIGYVSFNVF